MKYFSRLYQGQNDYEKIKNLINEIISIRGTPFHGSVGDFEFWATILSEADELFKAELYFTKQDNLIAFFWPSDSSFDLFIHPHYQEVIYQILNKYQTDFEASKTDKISCEVFENEFFKQKALRKNGFKKSDSFIIHYQVALNNYNESPLNQNKNYRITVVSSLKTIERKIECYKGCFPDHQINKQKYFSMMKSESYNKEFDLVLVNQDKKVLSFATIWIDSKNSIGTFEPVGTHKKFRGRGLAAYIMKAGLKKIKDNNINTAYLKTSYKNHAAQALYQKLGFKEIAREYRWEKFI